jgi:hypothetical protein
MRDTIFQIERNGALFPREQRSALQKRLTPRTLLREGIYQQLRELRATGPVDVLPAVQLQKFSRFARLAI